MSFVSSKGNILCRLVKIELYKIFAIINRAIKGLHCTCIICKLITQNDSTSTHCDSLLLFQARDVGSSQNRWLLVNIQDVKEFACQMLNRDVWSHQAVKGIIGEHFVFWQVGFTVNIADLCFSS